MAKYSWKITAGKIAINAVYVILAGLVSVYGNSNWYMALAPLFVGIENYLKHI